MGELAEVEERIETDDYEKLAKEMGHASPLEIMDRALEKFGNDIAIAFRYFYFFLSPASNLVINFARRNRL